MRECVKEVEQKSLTIFPMLSIEFDNGKNISRQAVLLMGHSKCTLLEVPVICNFWVCDFKGICEQSQFRGGLLG